MNLFEMNPNLEVKISEFRGTPVYEIENFYKYPEEIVYWMINDVKCELWKSEQDGSRNGINFHDYKHIIVMEELREVYDYISSLLDLPYDEPLFVSNVTRFNQDQLPLSKDGYWWPHRDSSMNCIIYLNKDVSDGTNIYEQVEKDKTRSVIEHSDPWRPKRCWERVRKLEARFNKLVIFDSGKLWHGASTDDESFFHGNFRMNQIIAFK